MNFDMAGEMLEMEDINSTTVLLADDVASAPKNEREKRRGVAGMIYAYKIAGAAAEQMKNLEDVTRIAQKTADACHSVGAALTSCTVPQAGKSIFEISPISAYYVCVNYLESEVIKGQGQPQFAQR